MPPSSLHIAVLLPSPSPTPSSPGVQLLDLSPIDLFSMLSRAYLTSCSVPSPILSLCPDIRISYVSSLPPRSPVLCTANLTLLTTHSLSSSEAAPGEVDVILFPGPDPAYKPAEEEGTWVKAHMENGATLMTVCTGAFWAGRMGLYEGRRVTGPRALLPALRKEFPGAEWVDGRWTVDMPSQNGNGKEGGGYGADSGQGRYAKRVGTGEVWSSGGITNGLDMVAAYLRGVFPGPLAETVCAFAEVGDRGMGYGQGKVGMYGWFGWLVVRAWIGGLFGGKGGEKEVEKMK